jgi:succinoglycan biosynthesis transport protein ExoP
MSLVQFLRILYARRLILLAALLGCFTIAFITAMVIPPRYTATTRILLQVGTPDPVTGAVIGDRAMWPFVKTQIELIKDYRTAGRVVDALGWENNPDLVTEYNKSSESSSVDLRRWLAQRIINGTGAALAGNGAGILEISFTSSSPDSAKQIADLIRAAYVEESLRFRRANAGRIADWYGEQSEKALARLAAAEKKRNDYAKEQGIVLDSSNTDVESAKLTALTGQSAMAGLGGGGIVTQGGLSPVDQLDTQIAQASMSLGPNHPTMIALKRQRAALASAPAAGVSGGVSAAKIESAFNAQKSRVLGQRDAIDQLRQMQNEIDLRRDQYLKGAQRVADFQLQANVGETGMEPLGDASAPEKPSFPNVPAILAGSIAIGAALGVCLALLVELLGRRVRSDDDLGYATGAPVFAVVGTRRAPDSLSGKFIRFLERRKIREAAEQVRA